MFKLLRVGDTQWVTAVMALAPNRRDIHYDARMAAPYVAVNKWEAFLALTSNDDGYIVEPVLVTDSGELRHSYNFGGPMGSVDLVNSREHTESLREWAQERGFKSKYTTLV